MDLPHRNILVHVFGATKARSLYTTNLCIGLLQHTMNLGGMLLPARITGKKIDESFL